METQLGLALGALYMSIETIKFMVTRKNGRAMNGKDILLLKLEEERHSTSIKAMDELRDWQRHIHDNLEALIRENNKTQVAVTTDLGKLRGAVVSMTKMLERMERGTV